MAIADLAVNALLDSIFGTGHSAIFPTSWELALSLTAPGSDGSGVTEPTDASYARATVPNTDAYWPPAAGRQKALAQSVSFPQPAGVWSTVLNPVRWVVLFDLSGNYLGGGILANAMVIDESSTPPTVPANTLVVYVPS